MKGFASDNYAGAHPDVLAAMAAASDGHAVSYGADPWTQRADALLREHFGAQAEPFLVFNGSGANVCVLRAALRPWQAVVCAQGAHIAVDEAGAAEWIAGTKLMTVPAADGKLRPQDVEGAVVRVGDEHAVQPGLVSITQTTESGTLYAVDEIRALAEVAHAHGMRLHVDGSRLANAAAALGVGLREMTTDAGVDAVSFGGTKNGLVAGEAVVLLDPALADGFKWIRKQTLQLASKSRFLAAGFVALLEGDLWLRSARHANAMAARLAAGVSGLPGVRITQPVQGNHVFAVLPAQAAAALQADWPFYTWDERTGEVRWMCAWDHTPEEVDAFAAAIAGAVGAPAAA